MDFALSADQLAIRETVETYLAETAGLERLREMIGGTAAFDDALWAGLAGEMGFAGLMVPEAFGGAGLGAVPPPPLLVGPVRSALRLTRDFRRAALSRRNPIVSPSSS